MKDLSHKRGLRVIGIILVAIATTLLLISFSGNATETGETDAASDYPDTPARVVEAFYESMDNDDCVAAMRFLSFDAYENENHKIELFIKSTANSNDIQKLGDEIRGMEEVESLSYISKEEALERLRSSLGENAHILNQIIDNPLPSSYEITVKDAKDVEKVALRFFNNPIVDNTPGSDPSDGVKYSAGTSKSIMNGARDICNLVSSEYDYRLVDFRVVDESTNNDEAAVKFAAVAAIHDVESTPDEFVFKLVKSEGLWKIDYFKSQASINSYSGFFGFMLINNKDMGQKIDTTKLGYST